GPSRSAACRTACPLLREPPPTRAERLFGERPVAPGHRHPDLEAGTKRDSKHGAHPLPLHVREGSMTAADVADGKSRARIPKIDDHGPGAVALACSEGLKLHLNRLLKNYPQLS